MKTKTVKEVKEKMSAEEMKKAIELDKRNRAEEMRVYLEAGLKKFNCRIEPIIQISAQGNKAIIDIQPI